MNFFIVYSVLYTSNPCEARQFGELVQLWFPFLFIRQVHIGTKFDLLWFLAAQLEIENKHN